MNQLGLGRWVCVCFVWIVLSQLLWAQDTLKEARQRWLKGNFDEALTHYETLSKTPATQKVAALGLSRVQQSKGDYPASLATITQALKADKPTADLWARHAELLFYTGKRAEALDSAEQALKLDQDHFLARFVRAQVYHERGDLAKADQEYRWFVRTYTERSNADKEIKDPEQLVLVGLAGCENVRLNIKEDNTLSEQFTFILQDVYGDAVKHDKDYWPAELQAGLLLLEKYNRGEALKAFDNVLKIFPNCPEALVGKGTAALQRLELKETEDFVDKALKQNPNLPEALRLKSDLLLFQGSLSEALAVLEKAKAVNPKDERTLGRLAAVHYLLKESKSLQALQADVEKQNAKPGLFYYELASHLETRRHFEEAEKHFKKAAELRPDLIGPQNGLGLLYMRMGLEAEARKVLDQAFKADPFNVRVSNNLKVLRHLDKYETLKTAHFELRFDPKKDALLAKFMGEALEEIYKDLAAQFGFEAKGPILIEVFNNHEMFSGRVISLPDLHTIGACTGKMVAMVSPTGAGLASKFNWGRVLRHELVHIFNLEQTKYQIPHWLTEGLAVDNEGFPRPPKWNELLADRVASGKLSTLENVDMGFMKPTSPDDWQMAYCQSHLYVEYLRKTYGGPCIGELLVAFRDGLATPAAIKKVCKVEMPEFEKGYRAHLEALVKGLKGRAPQAKKLSFEEAKKAYEANAEDHDAAAQYAEYLLLRRDRVEARKLADAILSKKPKHAGAANVKAQLHLAAGDEAEAQKLLEAALDEENPDVRVLAPLAKIYFNNKEPAKAVKLFELGRRAEPYEKKWLEGLAKVYGEANEKAKQIAALKELVPLDADDFANRRKLAQLLAADSPAEAEKFAKQALEIDVNDKEVHEILLKSLKSQKKEAELARYEKLLGK